MNARRCAGIFAILLTASASAEQPFFDRTHDSKVFGEARHYRILFPPDYENRGKRYAVIYYFHGHSDRYTVEQYDNGTETIPKMADWVAKHDAIVVCVDGYVAADYTGFYGGSPWDLLKQGGNHDFGPYFLELVQHIDSTYRTLTDRRHRATSGLSMGGFMSLYLSARYPDWIGSASAFNPGPEFYAGEHDRRVLWSPKDHLTSHLHTMVRLVRASGDYISQYHEETRAAYARSAVDFEYRQDEYHRHWATSIAETFDFHDRAFHNPALDDVPQTWSYSSPYRSFDVWGYRAKVDAPGAGMVYIEAVHQGGVRVTTRRWAPDGPPMESAAIHLSTAPLYAPGETYKLLDCKLSGGQAQVRAVTADANGRIDITVDGDGHQISFAGPGTGAGAPLLLPLTSSDRLRLPAGLEIHLPVRIYNPRAEALTDVTGTLSSEYPTVELLSNAVTIPRIEPGGVADLTTKFTVKFTAGGGYFAPTLLRLKLTYEGWRESTEDIDVLVTPDRLPAPTAYQILDGRTVTLPVFRQKGNQGGGKSLPRSIAEGKGNGDGKLDPGEEATIWVQLDQGLDPFDKGNWYRTKIYSDSLWIVEADRLEEQKQLEWTSAKERTSVIRLAAGTPPGTEIPLLLDNESWSFTFTPDVRYGKERLYQAFQLHQHHLHRLTLIAGGEPDREKRPSPASGQEWKSYGGDPGGTKFSPLRQIDRSNVARLKPAWIYHTGDISDGTKWPTRSAFESTPLAVDGVLYLTTAFSRLVALDAATGRELWSFDPKIDRDQATNLFINRGAAYWSQGSMRRILVGTIQGRLFSIVAETGKPDDNFGQGGSIDLRQGVAAAFPGKGYGMTSPPAIYKDLVICGSLVPDGEPRGPAGDVRAFDVRTGKLVWTFHTVARKGEFGGDTWPEDGWQNRGGLNAWPPLSIDTERGIVFLPLTSPATDFYGGDRKGAGLFGDSLVALDAATGKRLWHFQTVHHNLWDYDLPAQPVLVQVRHEGAMVDAVAQVTKTGFTFVFDRTTGAPLFPIEEVRVPASEVPGEQAWPTQPRPIKPPPYARQTMSPDELTNVTPESRAYCAKLLDGAVFGGIFTPIGLRPTILFPGTNGGANWGGASFDPETHTLYVNSMDVGMLYHMVERPDGSAIPYRPQGSGTPNSRFWDADMLPCQKPPWGFLTAIDLDKGEFRWRAVLGVVDALLEKGLPPTGSPNLGGSLVTAGGLVFIGATNDGRFRAFDKDNGRELWVTRLPASAHATPTTYADPRSGRQFVVIAAGGGNKYNKTYSDSLIAFALPSGSEDREPIVQYHHESVTSRAEALRDQAPTPGQRAQTAFSHRQHASLKLACMSCHTTAETGAHAGFPASSACLTCHQSVALPAEPARKLPDFVFFSHARHDAAHLACSACHGDIEKQDASSVSLPLKMAACIACHRANRAATSCTVCHELSQ